MRRCSLCGYRPEGLHKSLLQDRPTLEHREQAQTTPKKTSATSDFTQQEHIRLTPQNADEVLQESREKKRHRVKELGTDCLR